MAAIALTGLSKQYGDIAVVDGIDLEIEYGEFHCLVGPNGSGKTTLFRLILGVTQPTAGCVEREAGIGASFQLPNVYQELTVEENIDVFCGMKGVTDRQWVENVMAVLGLNRVEKRRAKALSGGYQKKLDIAISLLGEPEVLLLDEPLAELDDVAKEELLAFLSGYQEDGRTVVISTHQLEAFEEYLSRLTIVEGGKVVEDGRRGELTGADNGFHERYVERLRADASR